MNQKFNIQHDFSRTREVLSQMLNELSDTALQYVCRPIWYAYQWTDEHDMEALTDDDVLRFQLIGTAAYDTSETVKTLCDFNSYLFREELKKGAQS